MKRKVNIVIVLVLFGVLAMSSCSRSMYGGGNGKSCGCASKRQVG